MADKTLSDHLHGIERLIDELQDSDRAVGAAVETVQRLIDERGAAENRLSRQRDLLSECSDDDPPCRQLAEQEISRVQALVERLDRQRQLAEKKEKAAREALEHILERCESEVRELHADLKRENDQTEHIDNNLETIRNPERKENLYRQGEVHQAAAEELAEAANRLHEAIADLQYATDPSRSTDGSVAVVLSLLGATAGLASAGIGGGIVGGLAGLVLGKMTAGRPDTPSGSAASDRSRAKARRMRFHPIMASNRPSGSRGLTSPLQAAPLSRVGKGSAGLGAGDWSSPSLLFSPGRGSGLGLGGDGPGSRFPPPPAGGGFGFGGGDGDGGTGFGLPPAPPFLPPAGGLGLPDRPALHDFTAMASLASPFGPPFAPSTFGEQPPASSFGQPPGPLSPGSAQGGLSSLPAVSPGPMASPVAGPQGIAAPVLPTSLGSSPPGYGASSF